MAELSNVLNLLVARVGTDDDGELLEEGVIDVAMVDLKVDAWVQLSELNLGGVGTVLANVSLAEVELQRRLSHNESSKLGTHLRGQISPFDGALITDGNRASAHEHDVLG